MSASAADVTKIRTLVSRLRKHTLRDSNQIALVGLMTGVLYALQRTVELSFDDARMKLDPDIERSEIGRTLEALENCHLPNTPWLAGFYLDSAIMRLSALNERIDKYLQVNQDTAAEIRKVVNKIKHEVDAGITSGWTIKFSDILKASEDLCVLLEKSVI